MKLFFNGLLNLLIIVMCFFLQSCGITKQTTFQNFQPKANHQLRIASYNVNWGDGVWKLTGRANTIRAMQETNADIILLQETSFSWEKLITHYLAKKYPYRYFNHFYMGRGDAVLSRYPIHTRKFLYSYRGWYPAWTGFIDTPFGKIQLLNVHLISTKYFANSIANNRPYGLFEAATIRKQEMQNYFSQLDNHFPLIIAGDFNEGRGSAINLVKNYGYIDAGSLMSRPTFTWYWPLGIITLRSNIDHIFYHPSYLRSIKTQVLHEGDSDHFPVVVDLIPTKLVSR